MLNSSNFSFNASVGCPGYESTFSGNSLYGQISSPSFEGYYPNNARCSWNVQVDPTKTIQLTILGMLKCIRYY